MSISLIERETWTQVSKKYDYVGVTLASKDEGLSNIAKDKLTILILKVLDDKMLIHKAYFIDAMAIPWRMGANPIMTNYNGVLKINIIDPNYYRLMYGMATFFNITEINVSTDKATITWPAASNLYTTKWGISAMTLAPPVDIFATGDMIKASNPGIPCPAFVKFDNTGTNSWAVMFCKPGTPGESDYYSGSYIDMSYGDKKAVALAVARK